MPSGRNAAAHILSETQRARESKRESETETETEKTASQTDRQTDRQADRQTGRQTDRQTDRMTGWLSHTYTHLGLLVVDGEDTGCGNDSSRHHLADQAPVEGQRD